MIVGALLMPTEPTILGGDDVKKSIEVLQFLFPRRHGIVAEIILWGRIDVGQFDRLFDAIGPQKLLGVSTHRQSADA